MLNISLAIFIVVAISLPIPYFLEYLSSVKKPTNPIKYNYSKDQYTKYWLRSVKWNSFSHLFFFSLQFYWPEIFDIQTSLSDFNLLREFMVAVLWGLIMNTIFYWTHLALHSNRWIYKNFHAFHHDNTYVPCLWDAYIASHFEYFLYSFLATYMFYYLLKIHVMTFLILVLWNNFETCRNHSAYDPHHFKHHGHLNCNFGPTPLWDILMKTYKP